MILNANSTFYKGPTSNFNQFEGNVSKVVKVTPVTSSQRKRFSLPVNGSSFRFQSDKIYDEDSEGTKHAEDEEDDPEEDAVPDAAESRTTAGDAAGTVLCHRRYGLVNDL